MQAVRDAKLRAYEKLEQARIEKDQQEDATRSLIENKREMIQRVKLEGALNTRRTVDEEILQDKKNRALFRQ